MIIPGKEPSTFQNIAWFPILLVESLLTKEPIPHEKNVSRTIENVIESIIFYLIFLFHKLVS